jgi:hypothetical protein
MNRPRRLALLLTALLSALLLGMVVVDRDLLRDPRRPAEVAQWLAAHPADWIAASGITESALDTPSPQRVVLWRSAHAHAKRLAPRRPDADVAFVKGGLFHWNELDAADRGRVLQAAAPLMRETPFFDRMHVPIWQLTRDFAWLRRTAPDTIAARRHLRDLALAGGLFAEYRTLREHLRADRLQEFQRVRSTGDPAALLAVLPQNIEVADEPLVRAILTELDRIAFEPDQLGPRIDQLLDYAADHRLGPLTGVVPLLQLPTKLLREVTRARAALALNDAGLATRIEVSSAVPGTEEWDAYFLDRALFEARRGDGAAARAYLGRVSSATDPAALAAAEEVATILGDGEQIARVRNVLLTHASEPRRWLGTCGPNELCTTARTTQVVTGRDIRLDVTVTQTDELPPYVEVFIDDRRVAEGEVRDRRTFVVPAAPGVRSVEVRLANPRTRNGVQRRLRLS